MIMKIGSRGQIRIPKRVLESLKIEPGDYVEVDLERDYAILRPRKLIDPSQSWYWTKEWQSAEVEVDEEIQNDQVSPVFHTAEEGLKWLKE